MMKFFKLLFSIIFMLMVFNANAQKNLVENGGFEDNLYGWNDNGGKITPWDFKSGKNSCAIITTGTDKWVGIDQSIRIPKKTGSLEFSAWIKANNVVKGEHDWDGAIFSIAFLDGSDKEIEGGDNIAHLTGDQNWTRFSKIIKVPARAVSFKILLAMGNASGGMIIDDVYAAVVNDQLVVK
ncbi:carbohydrate binding domain-containing protein [Mucilaginibacter dorajii]|nr:carbohydrate binding domain-containing protein [Mucilaginibacter dorajii]MCS3736685.1 hypothetical protein [Mucilaginibacter dorajii]